MTPLLVPSFSSRTFSLYEVPSDGGKAWLSEAGIVLEALADHLDESCLVSAYDIDHGHLGDVAGVLSRPQLVFIDSGGYECEPATNNLAGLYAHPFQPRDWSAERYERVLASLPLESPTQYAFVSFDILGRGRPVKRQIEDACVLLGAWPDVWSVVLLKPSDAGAPLDVNEILENSDLLTQFDVVGVAEKELDDSLLGRVEALIKLRAGLDVAGVSSPLHLFGALDPLLVPVYFLAGAEIFDGLSWLRFGFRDGLSVHLDAWGALELDPSTKTESARIQARAKNLAELGLLKRRLVALAQTGDLSIFGPHSDLYSRWHETISILGGR